MRPSGGDQPLGLHAGGETLPNKWPLTEGPGNRAAAKPDLRRGLGCPPEGPRTDRRSQAYTSPSHWADHRIRRLALGWARGLSPQPGSRGMGVLGEQESWRLCPRCVPSGALWQGECPLRERVSGRV